MGAEAAEQEIKNIESKEEQFLAKEKECETVFKTLSSGARLKARDMIGDIFWANATWATKLAAAKEAEEEIKASRKKRQVKKTSPKPKLPTRMERTMRRKRNQVRML